MERMTKAIAKKSSASQNIIRGKNSSANLKNKAAKKYSIQHFIHPDYILFDWEFFSRELEFE